MQSIIHCIRGSGLGTLVITAIVAATYLLWSVAALLSAVITLLGTLTIVVSGITIARAQRKAQICISADAFERHSWRTTQRVALREIAKLERRITHYGRTQRFQIRFVAADGRTLGLFPLAPFSAAAWLGLIEQLRAVRPEVWVDSDLEHALREQIDAQRAGVPPARR